MPKPVHAQPTAVLTKRRRKITAAVMTERRRKITARAADLCRAQPAVFAVLVREADRLRAQGVSDVDALERALGRQSGYLTST